MTDEPQLSAYGITVPPGIAEEMRKYDHYLENRLSIWYAENWEISHGHYEEHDTPQYCYTCECLPTYTWIEESTSHVKDHKQEDFTLIQRRAGRPILSLFGPTDGLNGKQIEDNIETKTLQLHTNRSSKPVVFQSSNFTLHFTK